VISGPFGNRRTGRWLVAPTVTSASS
jgi:hypothetical protein